MASDLSLSISVSAIVGGALSGLTNIGKAMNTLKSTTANLTAKQKELGESLERNRHRLSDNSVVQLTRDYERLSLVITQLKHKHQQLAHIQAQRTGNEQQWQNIKGRLTGAIASAGALTIPIKLAIDFESAMADVKKVVDFETPQQFKQMGDDILAMSRKIPMAATELAKIVALGGQSGIDRDNLMKFAESAAKMGVAFDISAEQAGQSMAELRSAFQLDQSGVETLADKINYLGNTTPAAAKGIMEIVQRVGAFGTVSGYNTGTVAALGATMRGFGIQEEVAATSIKNMMLALVAGETATKSQKTAWKKLGLDHKKIAKDMQKDAEGTTLKVLESVSKLEKHAQASTLKELFGSESLLGIAPLLSSIDTVKKNLEGVKNTANFDGSMNKEYEARAATTANNIQSFKNSLSELSITLGTILLPTVNRFLTLVTSVINSITTWAKQHPTLTKTIVGTTAAILAFISGGFVMRVLGNRMIAVLLSIRSGVAALSASITAVRAVMQSGMGLAMLSGSLGKVVRGFMAMRSAMMITALPAAFAFAPLLLAIGSVAAAALLIYQYWKPIKAFFIGFWKGFKDGFAPIMPLLEMIGAGWKGLFDLASALFQPVINWFRELGWVSEETTESVQGFGYFFGVMLGSVFGSVITIGEMIVSGWRMIFDGIFSLATTAWESIKTAFNGGLTGILSLILNWSPIGAFYSVFTAVLNWFGISLPAQFTDFGKMMIDGLVNGIKAKFNQAIETIQNLGTRLKEAFTGAKAMDIHSPSRVFKSYGSYITEGLAIGVHQGAAHPLNRIGQLAHQLRQRFTKQNSGLQSHLSADLSHQIAANAAELSQARQAYQAQNAGTNGAITIHFNPTIHAAGGNVEHIQEAMQMSLREFETLFHRMMADRARRAY